MATIPMLVKSARANMLLQDLSFLLMLRLLVLRKRLP